MGRVVQDWIARPFHPELDRYLRAGVSRSYCKFCAEHDIFPTTSFQKKERSWRESRRRAASGERRRARTGQGAEARVEERDRLAASPRVLGGGGVPDAIRG